MFSRKRLSLRLGDYRRVLLCAMEQLTTPVVLVTITGPSAPSDVALWNRSIRRRFSQLHDRAARRCERRLGRRPVMVASLVQRQRRGVDHFHIPLRAAPWDHETNRLYIASLKELGSSYDFGYVDDGYLPRHPKLPNGRPNRSLPKRNLVFEDPIVAGRYLCRYLTDSAQLIELLTSRERVSRPLWVNPELTRASGVICRRLRRVRLAFHVVRALDAGSRPRLPAWWGDLGERRKTLALLRMPTALGP